MNTLYTKCFTLHPIAIEDAKAVGLLCNDPLIAQNTARIPHPYTMKDAQEFARAIIANRNKGTEHAFTVCEDGVIIACAGAVHLERHDWEIGYWVGADARGRGVATEAARAITHFAFNNLGASIVHAGYFFDNPASGRILEKLGYRPTGETASVFSLGRNAEVVSVRVAINKAEFSSSWPHCA